MERAAFLDRLTEYGGLARDALLKQLPDGEPRAYLYQPIRDFCARAGKGLRPALLLATCRAFGGQLNDALTSAAALELLHNAFLIHDDIQDQSESRRGFPCLYTELGTPLAMIARPGSTSLDIFNAFGFFLGSAFQIQDDVLNLIGSRDLYGKEIFGDIYEGKRTLVLSRLAGSINPTEHARLSRFLSLPRSQRRDTEVAWVFDAIGRHDCVGYARQAAARLVEGARAAFPSAFAGASGEDREFIAHCLDFMTERGA